MKNEKFKIKNLFLVLAAVVFVGGVLLNSVGLVLATPTPTPTPAKVDYFLAYPGILPDHFLYSVKMIRDRIWLFLTTDSLRKAETLLLFADKRLGAGKALIEGGKQEKGITTLSKAEKYLEQAINQEKIAREKGKETKALLEKLSRATLKHEDVLSELEKKVSGVEQTAVRDLLRYSRQGYEEVKKAL